MALTEMHTDPKEISNFCPTRFLTSGNGVERPGLEFVPNIGSVTPISTPRGDVHRSQVRHVTECQPLTDVTEAPYGPQ